MRLDLILLGGWTLFLALLVHFGRGLGHWAEAWGGALGHAFLASGAAVGFCWARAAWRGLPLAQRRPALAWLALLAAGLALLAWLQPLLIESLHVVLYGVLGVLALRALRHRWQGAPLVGLAFGLAAAIGALDEGLQHLHPQRVGDVRDVATNALASGIMVLAAWRLQPRPAGARPEK